MLIYLDETSAIILRYLLKEYVLMSVDPDKFNSILNQLDEGLKNYEKE